MGVSENQGYLILGPYNKDPTIWGTILGSPVFGNSHIGAVIGSWGPLYYNYNTEPPKNSIGNYLAPYGIVTKH